MKRMIVILFTMFVGIANLVSQTKYLVNYHEPVDSYRYTAFKYTGPSSKKIAMSGGLNWSGGFTIRNLSIDDKPGYATFKLGGKYAKLSFVLGHENCNTGAGGTGISTEPGIVVVYADGRKVLDEKVYPYGIPKRFVLDIKGVDELKFAIVTGEIYVGVAEATLWTSGQDPVETGNVITQRPKAIQLVTDLKPYFQNNKISNVLPTEKYKSLKMNGREYTNGLHVVMSMALVGDNPGWAYFNLRKQYAKLSFVVGPIDNPDSSGGRGWITVKADGKIIYELELAQDDIAQKVILDVTGCEMLSFHSEQSDHSMSAGIADITAYPEGDEPENTAGISVTSDPKLAALPDVCKLISNIPPYAVGGLVEHQVYDGTSDYITFSMGGVKFSEGFILYEKANILDDNISSYAVFDLGNQFDYVSFTAGYLGKSGVMNNDILRVYADDKMVLEAPLISTQPNQQYTVPLYRCRKLRFENKGSSTLDVAAYGVADIVVYRGEPVKNNLFVHPKPDCPPTIDLIDLGAPYIHYVSPKKNEKDEIFYDGTTRKKYFDLNGQRIYKGFMLQTSVHFSLDHGVLSGTDGAATGVVGGIAVGSAFVAGGVAVGGAMVGSTLIGAAAFLMLAAGGEALENSCAAFNTYGEYNSVTFTVACCNPHIKSGSYKETLLIGADHKVVAQLTVYETMEPQTVTVPINGCEQLMFWLANTGNWSGQYIFYDIKLTKDSLSLHIPKDAVLSEAVITKPAWTITALVNQWERPTSSGQDNVDAFLRNVSNSYSNVLDIIEKAQPHYEIYTYYLKTDAGQVCKAITLGDNQGNHLSRITVKHSNCASYLEQLDNLKKTLFTLSLNQANAALGLPELGLGAISYGKLIKRGSKVLKELKRVVDVMYEEKLAEYNFLNAVLNKAVDIDGQKSTEKVIFCPLFEGEVPPTNELQLVKHFYVDE